LGSIESSIGSNLSRERIIRFEVSEPKLSRREQFKLKMGQMTKNIDIISKEIEDTEKENLIKE